MCLLLSFSFLFYFILFFCPFTILTRASGLYLSLTNAWCYFPHYLWNRKRLTHLMNVYFFSPWQKRRSPPPMTTCSHTVVQVASRRPSSCCFWACSHSPYVSVCRPRPRQAQPCRDWHLRSHSLWPATPTPAAWEMWGVCDGSSFSIVARTPFLMANKKKSQKKSVKLKIQQHAALGKTDGEGRKKKD